MEAKVLVIGDLHIKKSNIVETQLLLQRLLDVIEELNGVDTVVLLGDTLNDYEHVNLYPHVESLKIIETLTELTQVVLLIGNHDIPNESLVFSDLHPYYALRKWSPVIVADTACRVFTVKGCTLAAMPYCPVGKFNECLESSNEYIEREDEISALFTHQQFIGTISHKSQINKGDRWSRDKPPIYNGHIHTPKVTDNGVNSVGVPRQTKFNEDPNGCFLLLKFTDNGGKRWSIEEKRIPVGLPPKIVYRITAADLPTWEPPVTKGDIKVVISGTFFQNSLVEKTLEVANLRKLGIKVTYETLKTDLPLEPLLGTSKVVLFSTVYENKIKDNERFMEIHQRILNKLK